jgi:hypothetical protein
MRRSPLRRQSAKAVRLRAARRELAQRLLPAGCGFPGCSRAAAELHEPLTRGRGGDAGDVEQAEPVCREHHDLIHMMPSWSRRHGWLTSMGDDPDAARRKRRLLNCPLDCQDQHHDYDYAG